MIMILEELVGYFVALGSNLISPTSPISRESLQRDCTLICEANREEEEDNDGLIHREYGQEIPVEVPYHEEHLSGSVEAGSSERTPSFLESFLRSFQTNLGMILAVVFILGLFTVGLVYVDLSTSDACIEWMKSNLKVPSNVRILHIIGMSVKLLPLYTWLPTIIVMLWGFEEFKKNHLVSIGVPQLLIGSISCVYRIIVFDKLAATNFAFNPYRLPSNFLFMFSMVFGCYLVARKLKKVNPDISHSLFHIFVLLSFAFVVISLFAYVYSYVIIKYFRETKGKIMKAIIAALTPGTILPFTAIAKYLVLRRGFKIIAPDRAYLLCYFLRGCSVTLYRTMQAGLHNIWLFVGLSLLHGASNVLSKATLNFRIKVWTFLVGCLNRICCVPRFIVLPLNTPRIRRLNADLEIQNILLEYTTTILSQVYLACYHAMSYNVPPWLIMKQTLIRVAVSLAIDFLFNTVSVYIQIHVYDLPMRKIWQKYWRRHVICNAFLLLCGVSYFGGSLVSVFVDHKLKREYGLRNCTSVFLS